MLVYVDGAALPEEEARAMWRRFSDFMEEHKGDLAGFAAAEGFASVHPAVENGKPVLHASKTSAQRPYASVTTGMGREPRSSGSASSHRAEANGRNSSQKRRR